MKVIIAGTRKGVGGQVVIDAIRESGFDITEVVSGGAPGVDREGEAWAWFKHIPVKVFKADWRGHGEGAGPIRNQAMVDYADAIIAIPGQKSPGTQDVMRRAMGKGLKVYVHGFFGMNVHG